MENVFQGFGHGFPGAGGFSNMGFQSRDPSFKTKENVVSTDLPVTLEEIDKGTVKKMKVHRKVATPQGGIMEEQKILEVEIKPGWKAGTKVTFPREGDEIPGKTPEDIVFIIQDKPHSVFTRDGHDIKYKTPISLKQALCGGQLNIPTLDKGHVPLPINDVISPETVKKIPGHGLPYPKDPGRRGDLLVEFEIIFPDAIDEKSLHRIEKALKKIE